MKKIFSIRVANELVRLGYRIIDVHMNLKNPKLRVFVFKIEGNFEEDLVKIAGK